MSDDYSSFERDYFRKSKRRQDFKPNKISPKQIKVYEPKSAQKTIKPQGYADEPDYSPPYGDDYYDDYAIYNKSDTYKTYVSKTASSSKSKQGGNNRFTVWKKEIVKSNKKGAGESQKAISPKEDVEWVVSPKTTLFFEEKAATVNNSNPKTLPTETKHSSGEDSSMISAGLSTTANTEDRRRSSEMFDFSQDRPDPIQAMKALRRKESQGEEKVVKKETVKEEEGDKGKESTKDESNIEVKEESEKVSEDKELGEGEENYSDIDGLMEKKLLNNEVEVNSDEDAFNEANAESRKKDLEELDNNERPLWEDLDTNKMLEDIKKFDHLSMFSKDIKTAWKGKEVEAKQGNKEVKKPQDIWVRDRKLQGNIAEEGDDDFEKFFSLKICDETDDMIPNIFHIWHKASSDKQLRDNNTNENRLMKSQSFDSEIIKRKDSHTPLPAFRNYCLQQETTKEEQPKPQTSLFNTVNKPKESSPSNYIFRSLIPNHDAKLWYYRDLQGNVQGPFSGQLMDEWYSRGYLPLDLDITIASSSGYRKLRELVDITKRNEGLVNNNSSYIHVAQPNLGAPTTSQYPMQAPTKMLSGQWGQNQNNLNRDNSNAFNKGILSSQLLSQGMTGPKQAQPANIFSNLKSMQQEKTQGKTMSSEYQKNNQNDSVFSMVDNSKRPFQNVITENCCPNIGSYNIFASNLASNASNKSVRANPQPQSQAQIHLSYPLFNSQFESFSKGVNSNQVIPSGYRPQQMMSFNQAQGFDGSKVEANSNQLRNLPR